MNEGTGITLTGGDSTDPDGHTLSYQWSQVSGPNVTLSTSTSANSGFTAPQVTSNSTVVVRLTITQGTREATSDISIAVNNVVTTPPPAQDSGGGGGGAVNLYWFMLLFLALWRQQVTRKKYKDNGL